ncbi:hypothetical protein [Gymnodinialimonas hymeniacidonis]|uniref:hypothetical protein n=1 Tax=Gymnodinialimonas hymeniacidonis TaxID=3126508 RepID=UPI0034C6C0C9
MSKSLMLDDFSSTGGAGRDPAQKLAPADTSNEAASLDAYEAGYKNGWSDCAAAEAEERKSVGAHLAQKLRDAELTYEKAHSDILEALSPFFQELIETLLPRLAAEALAPVAVEELRKVIEQETGSDIEISAAPSVCEQLQRLLDAEGLQNAHVRAEPAYSESQISLRVGCERREIELGTVTEKIASAVRAFQTQIDQPTFSKGAA